MKTHKRRIGLLCLALCLVQTVAAEEDFVAMREEMVDLIERQVLSIAAQVGRTELQPAVLEAVRRVPRHAFVPETLRDRAYGNHPLPIGLGQTISQPLMVALMTDLLAIDESSRVLEIGTGSGYQAAVLAEIVDEVYTIEVVEPLAQSALVRLRDLGYSNIYVRVGDGTLGWPERQPFDAIIVTAAGIEIPPALLDQLKPGGRMVMPIGAQDEVQQLQLIELSLDNKLSTKNVLPVRFVPITH